MIVVVAQMQEEVDEEIPEQMAEISDGGSREVGLQGGAGASIPGHSVEF